MLKTGTKVVIPDITKLVNCIQKYYTSGKEYKIVGHVDNSYEVSDDSCTDYWYMDKEAFEVVKKMTDKELIDEFGRKMDLKAGKKYKTKEFFELTRAMYLIGTPYEKAEITVVVEQIDLDGDYCLTILDDGRRIINEGSEEFFYTNDRVIKAGGAKFTEVKKMTDKELIDEFGRWVANGRGAIWYREEEWSSWGLISVAWDNKDAQYITNDKHAELRKLQIDKPDTKFEFFSIRDVWVEAKPQWNLELEYRVKVEPVYEWQWVIYLESIKEHVFSDYVASREELDISPTAKVIERFEKSKRIRK